MYGTEMRMLLRHYLEQGVSKSALARELGVSRDTVHRWIREGELERDLDADPPRYGPRAAVPTKLDPYKPIIDTRLEALPQPWTPLPERQSAMGAHPIRLGDLEAPRPAPALAVPPSGPCTGLLALGRLPPWAPACR